MTRLVKQLRSFAHTSVKDAAHFQEFLLLGC